MEYIIRPCKEDDLPGIVNLCKQHADYEQAAYTSEGKAELLSHALFSEPKKLYCYVIEEKGVLAGYFTYTFDFSTWNARTFLYLDCLYLEPEFRGRRIGETVFEKLKEIARLNDCINLQWQTPVFNTRAIKFYERMEATPKDKVRFTLTL